MIEIKFIKHNGIFYKKTNYPYINSEYNYIIIKNG